LRFDRIASCGVFDDVSSFVVRGAVRSCVFAFSRYLRRIRHARLFYRLHVYRVQVRALAWPAARLQAVHAGPISSERGMLRGDAHFLWQAFGA